MIYQVWSEVPRAIMGDELVQPVQILETRRTDKGAAYQDRDLIQSILRRKAWVQEINA